MFSLLGEGKGGSPRRQGGGGLVFKLKIAGKGGGEFSRMGPGGCLRRTGEFLGGGGVNLFFFGAETSTKSTMESFNTNMFAHGLST